MSLRVLPPPSLAALVEQARSGVLIATVENGRAGEVVYVNPAFGRLCGQRPETLIGHPAMRFALPPQHPAIAARMDRALAGGGSYIGPWLICRSVGSPLSVEGRITSVLDGAGEAVHFVYEVDEVEEERRNREQADELYRTLFDNAPFAKLLCDATSLRILEVNEAACQLYGYSRDELLNLSMERLCSSEEMAWMRWLASGASGPAAARFVHRSKSNTSIAVESGVQRLRVRDRDTLLVVATDLTERTRLEQQLFESQKMEAIGRLAGGIAHDFNNMLSAILGFGQILMQDLPPADPMAQDVNEIVRAAERAAALTRQLLAFSRKQILEPRVLDVGAHCRDMKGMLMRIIGEGTQLELRLAENLDHVKVDPGQLEQVILNLVLNARDAMPDGGTITITIENMVIDDEAARAHFDLTPGSYVAMSVRDTGVGVPQAVRERLFEPFFTTKDPGKGTGLGLATVFGVVKQSGGHILVDSVQGQGSVFRVLLPRTDEPVRGAEPAPRFTGRVLGDRTVLVVEDEPAVRHLVRRTLERQGFTVIIATNGKEALTLAAQPRVAFDVLITDVVMPRMSGPQLAERMRGLRPEIEVVFMSGYTENPIVHDDLSGQSLLFVAKPILPDVLVSRVHEALERQRARASQH